MTPTAKDYREAAKASVSYTYGPSGRCPVQAEGFINGHRFYFRSRGGHWALRVSSDERKRHDPLSDNNSWYLKEEYNGKASIRDAEINDGQKYAAGWAEEAECREAIQRMADIWLSGRRACRIATKQLSKKKGKKS